MELNEIKLLRETYDKKVDAAVKLNRRDHTKQPGHAAGN
jgi:hypothetical protein